MHLKVQKYQKLIRQTSGYIPLCFQKYMNLHKAIPESSNNCTSTVLET